MISEAMEKALNDQMNFELFSAYQYAACAATMEQANLDGFAHWLSLQVREEMDHAMKFYRFIMDVGGTVEFSAMAKPECSIEQPQALFENVLEHEREVSARIHKLVDLALKESNHPTNTFLQWFVTEQVEEEKAADDIVQRLKMVGGDKQGLFMLDLEMAKRAGEPGAA